MPSHLKSRLVVPLARNGFRGPLGVAAGAEDTFPPTGLPARVGSPPRVVRRQGGSNLTNSQSRSLLLRRRNLGTVCGATLIFHFDLHLHDRIRQSRVLMLVLPAMFCRCCTQFGRLLRIQFRYSGLPPILIDLSDGCGESTEVKRVFW